MTTTKLLLLGIAYILVAIAIIGYSPILTLYLSLNNGDMLVYIYKYAVPILLCLGLVLCTYSTFKFEK